MSAYPNHRFIGECIQACLPTGSNATPLVEISPVRLDVWLVMISPNAAVVALVAVPALQALPALSSYTMHSIRFDPWPIISYVVPEPHQCKSTACISKYYRACIRFFFMNFCANKLCESMRSMEVGFACRQATAAELEMIKARPESKLPQAGLLP